MVRAALKRFELKVDQFEDHLANRALLRRAVGEVLNLAEVAPALRDYAEAMDKHRVADGLLNYSAIVVLTYGAFEQLIEELIVEHIQILNRIVPTFQQLPGPIQAQHTDLSAVLLRARTTRKYETRVQEVELLQNLLLCAQGGANYRLNAMAFAQHSANLRIGLLNEMFAQVDVGGLTAELRQDAELSNIAAARAGVELANQPDSVVFRDLDDLAERRNDVAHGEVVNILTDSELMDVLKFVRALARALVAILEENALRHEIKFHGTLLPPPINVYNNRIVCFADSPVDLHKGGRLAALRANGRATVGRINEIQVNGDKRDVVQAHRGEAFGVCVGFHIKPNWAFYGLPMDVLD